MSRDFILSRIKKNINSHRSDETRRHAVQERVSTHRTGILPQMPKTRIKQRNHFITKVLASQASIEEIGRDQVSNAISRFLRNANLPNEIRIGEDPRLQAIHDSQDGMLTVSTGRSDGQDLVGVSHAEAGIVETGTLALFSGPDNPTTLNYLPENHIIVLDEADICLHYEDVWARVRARYGANTMPRNLNFITGPSRSADIEQTLLLGAHGPVRLHVLLTSK